MLLSLSIPEHDVGLYCRISVQAKLPSAQLSALENMHYSHMIRFDNVEEARYSAETYSDSVDLYPELL